MHKINSNLNTQNINVIKLLQIVNCYDPILTKKKKRKEKAKWKSHFTCIGIYRKEGWKHIHQNKYMVYFWVGGL